MSVRTNKRRVNSNLVIKAIASRERQSAEQRLKDQLLEQHQRDLGSNRRAFEQRTRELEDHLTERLVDRVILEPVSMSRDVVVSLEYDVTEIRRLFPKKEQLSYAINGETLYEANREGSQRLRSLCDSVGNSLSRYIFEKFMEEYNAGR